MQGWVDLVGWLHIPRWYTRPKTVTRPSTNRARSGLSLFTWRMPLTTPRRQPTARTSKPLWTDTFPLKVPFVWGRSRRHLKHVSLGPTSLHRQHLDRFSHICAARPRFQHTQTTLRCDFCSSRPHLCTACKRCNRRTTGWAEKWGHKFMTVCQILTDFNFLLKDSLVNL